MLCTYLCAILHLTSSVSKIAGTDSDKAYRLFFPEICACSACATLPVACDSDDATVALECRRGLQGSQSCHFRRSWTAFWVLTSKELAVVSGSCGCSGSGWILSLIWALCACENLAHFEGSHVEPAVAHSGPYRSPFASNAAIVA